MAKGKPGADSSTLVTHKIGGKDLIQLATDQFGETPVLWGRYFTSKTSTGDVEYRHAQENSILHKNNIRLLPIARQTKRVNGTQAQGTADATANVDDLIATFGTDYLASLGSEFLVFLDVEGDPSLSSAYFVGWAQELSDRSSKVTKNKVTFLPCVYATQADNDTWKAINDAKKKGATCHGAWVAIWVRQGCAGLVDWKDSTVNPSVKLPCKVLLWQYANECHGGDGFDSNQTNPNINLNNELLSKLILPPA